MDEKMITEMMKVAGLGPGGLAASGIAVSLFVFLLNTAKTWPPLIINWLKRMLTYSVQLDNSDPLYHNMALWLANRPNLTKTKNFIIRSGEILHGKKKANLVLGHGYHTFLYKGGLFVVHYSEETKDGGETHAPVVYRKFRIRVVWGGSKVLKLFLKELELADTENSKYISIHSFNGWNWLSFSKKLKRDPDTIILDAGQMPDLMEDVDKFLNSEDWYRQMGIPWRRGYLLYGEPGTGKSSLAYAIASKFDIPIFIANIRDSNTSLNEMFGRIPPRSLILLEDVDTANINRATTDRTNLGTLLNALDGVSAQEGSIVIMTTNYVESLDPALTRPGRVDRKFYIGLATPYQLKFMFERFFPNVNGQKFADVIGTKPVTPATVQEHLLRYKDDYKLALKHAQNIPAHVYKPREEPVETVAEEVPSANIKVTSVT